MSISCGTGNGFSVLPCPRASQWVSAAAAIKIKATRSKWELLQQRLALVLMPAIYFSLSGSLWGLCCRIS